MRIALTPDGSRGDVQPLLVLAKALALRQHQVVVCGPPDSREFVESAGVEFRSVGVSVRDFLSANAKAVTGSPIQLAGASVEYFQKILDLQFEMLPEATQDADLIVGAGVQLAAASVAEVHGVPYRYVAYCPAMFSSAEHAPFTFEWQTLPRWANRALWWTLRNVMDLPLRRSINRARGRLGLTRVPNAIDYFLTSNPLLATWRELAPMPEDSAHRAEQVGYLHPELGDPLPEKVVGFIESGPAPVYFGFGSMTDPNPRATTELHIETVAKSGGRALVSQGWAGLGEVPLPESVMVVPSMCHGRLFPRCAAVVHHGGAGTTSAAARAGVPQVIVPHLADQYYWAHRISRLGLGPPPVFRRRLEATQLATALECAAEEIVVERARELGERLQGQDPVARAVESLLSH
jgi:UDP:flavonoid glycosyltransferase YjiC (YdhE family)